MFSVEQTRYFLHYERMWHLILFSLEKPRLRGKLIEFFKIVNGFTNRDPINLLKINDSTRPRNNGSTLKCRQVHSDFTKFFFTNAVVRDWNKLPPSVKLKYIYGSKLRKSVALVLIFVTSALEPVAEGSSLPRDTGPEWQPGYHSLPSATARSQLLAWRRVSTQC